MLTAKDTTEDKIKGLDIGANDYLAKPFSFAELLARIRVQLRPTHSFSTTLHLNDLELDLLKKSAKRGNDTIILTAKEFALLEFLIKHKNQVVSESLITESLSNMEDESLSNWVNVYIYRLRNKIDKPYNKKLIHTLRGLGYKISDE
jgi:DNA-binding response OmpR family regulator